MRDTPPHYIDYHAVEPGHAEIHDRLRNWARWLFGTQRSKAHGMWAWCKPAHHWEAIDIGVPVDSLDAMRLEKAVYRLPEPHRDAVRWCYVYRNNPRRAAQSLGTTMDGLWLLVRDGRQMLRNRGG